MTILFIFASLFYWINKVEKIKAHKKVEHEMYKLQYGNKDMFSKGSKFVHANITCKFRLELQKKTSYVLDPYKS